MKSPVALVIFNRPNTTARVFAKIKEARPPRLYLIADGPRSDVPEDIEKIARTRQNVEIVDWDCEVTRIYSEENFGCGFRLPTGLNAVFENEENLIVLEDDCLPDISFFPYCDELLERYRHESRIMMISGRNNLQKWKKNEYSYYFTRIGSSWGWATWKRAWQYFDQEMKAWGNPILKDRIRRGMGNDREYFFRMESYSKVYRKEISTVWDYQWSTARFLRGGLTIFPSINIINNIGLGSDSTHTNLNDLNKDYVNLGKVSFPLIHHEIIIPDEEYDKKNTKALSTTSLTLIGRIKRKAKNSIKHFLGKIRILYEKKDEGVY